VNKISEMGNPVKLLSDQAIGFEGVIHDFTGDPLQILRLQELGFVRGESVKIQGRTSFGDPYVKVRDSFVALRTSEAKCIGVRA
jgi:Fe2+ transport system protein FeoA